MLAPSIDGLPYVDRAFLPQDSYKPTPAATDRRLADDGRTNWLRDAVHGQSGYERRTSSAAAGAHTTADSAGPPGVPTPTSK
jgi:hypothetical protein